MWIYRRFSPKPASCQSHRPFFQFILNGFIFQLIEKSADQTINHIIFTTGIASTIITVAYSRVTTVFTDSATVHNITHEKNAVDYSPVCKFLYPCAGDCRKKLKSLEPRRTRRAQRKRKVLLCALRVLRGSLLFRAFCDNLEGGNRFSPQIPALKKKPGSDLSSCQYHFYHHKRQMLCKIKNLTLMSLTSDFSIDKMARYISANSHRASSLFDFHDGCTSVNGQPV